MPVRKTKPIIQTRMVVPEDILIEVASAQADLDRIRREHRLAVGVVQMTAKLEGLREEVADLSEVAVERKKAADEMLALVEVELADEREKHRDSMQTERDAIIGFSKEARLQAEKARAGVDEERAKVEAERAAVRAESDEMVNREQALSVESLKVAQVLEELNMRAADLGAREGAMKRREAEVSGTQTDLAQRKSVIDGRAEALELWAKELTEGKMALGRQGEEMLTLRKKLSAEQRGIEDETRRLRAKAENIEQWKVVVAAQEKAALAMKADVDAQKRVVNNSNNELGVREARLLALEGRLRESEKRVTAAQEVLRRKFVEVERREAEVANAHG